MSVVIQGDGIAAHCCAHLLCAGGFQVIMEPTDRPRLPAIMLSEATQNLFRDVCKQEDLFSGQPRIRRRVVAWGPDPKPLTLEHAGVVVSEQFLVEKIGKEFSLDHCRGETEPDWTIVASGLLAGSAQHSFGSRVATVMQASVKTGFDPEACWIESLEGGWLFLIPAAGAAWLLSVGDPSQLQRSRVIADQIVGLSGSVLEFPAYPRIAWPLCGAGWLACGSAALAFDPLCGDGAGHAMREAILASAALRAVARGDSAGALLAHYEARMLAAFRRHLAVCRNFYGSGSAGPWWDSELEALHQGLEWCELNIRTRPDLRHRLAGFELQTLG